jgi:F0F1-type ATP synthase delta subunit
MQYNFQIRASLPDEDLKEIISAGPEGLEASSELVVQAKIRVNTELQDEHVESLREAVSSVLGRQLGIEAQATLLSSEH